LIDGSWYGRTPTKGGSSFRWNDNDFLPEILRRKGLN
jgi:hypothetical protein